MSGEDSQASTSPVQHYINASGLNNHVEDAVNACVKARANDPNAFMVRIPIPPVIPLII